MTNKRIALVFAYDESEASEQQVNEFLTSVAEDLNKEMASYEGFEGWRVEDDN